MFTALRLGRGRSSLVRQPIRCLAVDPEAPKRKQQKANKKKKKGTGGAEQDSMASKNMKIVMAALDAPMKAERAVSEEEKERRYQIGRNHVIGRFRQHNEIDHDLTCKIHLKQHAIRMLPRHSPLRDAALSINTTMPPPWRQLPVWTPPIPGFDPSQFVERVEEDD